MPAPMRLIPSVKYTGASVDKAVNVLPNTRQRTPKRICIRDSLKQIKYCAF